jgi:hypothetical protein
VSFAQLATIVTAITSTDAEVEVDEIVIVPVPTAPATIVAESPVLAYKEVGAKEPAAVSSKVVRVAADHPVEVETFKFPANLTYAFSPEPPEVVLSRKVLPVTTVISCSPVVVSTLQIPGVAVVDAIWISPAAISFGGAACAGATASNPDPSAVIATSAIRLKIVLLDIFFLSLVRLRIS